MPEDAGPSRPLAEILQEAKEAKDQKFKDAWKQMKIVRLCLGGGGGVGGGGEGVEWAQGEGCHR